MAKKSVCVKIDKELLNEAQKILGQRVTSATVVKLLKSIITNRKAIDLLKKTPDKNELEGFKN